MLRCEVTVSHSHLYCTVAHELSDRPDVYALHYKARREGAPIAMPRVVFYFCLLNRSFKPTPWRVDRVSIGIEEHWPGCCSTSLERLERIKRNGV